MMQRLTTTFPKFAWINPELQGVWQYRQSISVMQQPVQQRTYPPTVKGLEDACMRQLSKMPAPSAESAVDLLYPDIS
jgi:uncharacterized protein with von Willebrand factor type A (vWA) domain